MNVPEIVNRALAVNEALAYRDFSGYAEEQTWMEANYFGPYDDAWASLPDARPASAVDCAALLRWARFQSEDHIPEGCDRQLLPILDNVIRYLDDPVIVTALRSGK